LSDPGHIILLVEDDEDDQFFMQVALERAGIRDPLQVVSDGREAIAYLAGEGSYGNRSKYPRPTLIFLDLKMPYVSGFEVLEWLRARGDEFKEVAVVVLTSSPEERDHKRAYQLGARSYLLKPPTGEMLLDIMKMLALRPPGRGAE
jgi:CheY-like chemotaxis protein